MPKSKKPSPPFGPMQQTFPGRGLWGAPRHLFPCLPSTNTWLLEQDGCEHGETVRALCQPHGRGRCGRRWLSPPGSGLTFSVALHCSQCAPGPEYQGAVAALALAVCMEGYGLRPGLKWPNDVLLDGRKLAGILGESRSDAPDLVVVGVGCNVNARTDDFTAANLAATAVSMSMHAGRRYDLDAVFEDLLSAWQGLLDRLRGEGLPGLTDGWRARDILAGRSVKAVTGGRLLQGRVVGFDDRMALILRESNGTQHALRSGEVLHLHSENF